MNTADVLPLDGMSALITGGSGGIGVACAEALLRDGASVTLSARRIEPLEEARALLRPSVRPGARLAVIAGDSMVADDVKAALALACEHTGRVDICVPAVGGGGIRPFLLHDEKSFLAEIELNVMSAFLVIRHATPIMARHGGGSIVCVSSNVAKLAYPWLSSYVTGKAALEGMVRTLAEELSRFRIRVNAVRPGLTRTEGTAAVYADRETYDQMVIENPLGRIGEPRDIAAGVRYLAGPESSWVTGESIAIDGGNEMRKAGDMSLLAERIYGAEVFARLLRGEDPLQPAGDDGVIGGRDSGREY
ncbi:MAG TPA: SDR family oxidoreductase [Pseudomonadales bacterium]|nr:SDR family oxidoreductase [Pseudomonadales bacterium]HNC69564.1 SDR family oxidoreductase [Pseudomonadales bacterium]